MSDFLYYWQRYKPNTSVGPIYKLNQSSRVMKEIRAGHRVWAITLSGSGTYALAASFRVESAGRNNVGSVDYEEFGEFYFKADPDLSRFYSLEKNSVEALVRSLSFRPAAEILGHSFQGSSGVRRLSFRDASAISGFAEGLPALTLT